MKTLVMFGALVMLSGIAQAAVRTETVEYKSGEATFEGILAYDDAATDSRPGVVVVHDWMGVGPFVKGRVEALAKLGYVAFAIDIYGKGVRPKNGQEASAEAGKYRTATGRLLMRDRAKAGLDTLRKNPRVDPKRIAAMGYCFGGGAALELARSGADLVGAVSFHGTLATTNPDDARNIKGKILVLHGADDPGVPMKDVLGLIDEMRKAKVDYQVVLYGGAVHSFTNPGAGNDPSRGSAYNADADRRSWAAMQNFFAEVFGENKSASLKSDA